MHPFLFKPGQRKRHVVALLRETTKIFMSLSSIAKRVVGQAAARKTVRGVSSLDILLVKGDVLDIRAILRYMTY